MKWRQYKPHPMYKPDTGGAAGGGNPAATPAKPNADNQPPVQDSDTPPPADPPPKTYTQADIDALQADFDTRLAAAAQTAADEAVKTAGMSPEQKKAYEDSQAQTKRLADIEQRERDITLRELKSDTVHLLAAKELPAAALDMVLGADKAATEKNIAAFKTMFDAAVQAQVETRLSGKTPAAGQDTKPGDDIRDRFRKAMSGL